MALKDLLIRLGVKGDKKAKEKIKGVDDGDCKNTLEQ